MYIRYCSCHPGLDSDWSKYGARLSGTEVVDILARKDVAPQYDKTCINYIYSCRSMKGSVFCFTISFPYRHQTKRAILRQGHIPQAFYFVLSGSGQSLVRLFVLHRLDIINSLINAQMTLNKARALKQPRDDRPWTRTKNKLVKQLNRQANLRPS